jgi:hypothetical protein
MASSCVEGEFGGQDRGRDVANHRVAIVAVSGR